MIISEERCLQRYFEAEVVFSNHISSEERRKLFGAYADVYGVDVARADELFALAEDPALKSINSDATFKQQQRIQQFAEQYGYGDVLADNVHEMLGIKGKAISAVTEAKIKTGESQTSSDIASQVARASRAGNTTAMLLSMVMSLEGVLLKKDVALGKRILSKLALWTNVDAQLFGLKYDSEHASEYAARLAALTTGLPEAELLDVAKTRLYPLPKEDAGMKLLRKAVEKGFAQAENYNSAFSRISHSEILSSGDKQRVLLSGDEAFIRAVSTLPLKLPKKPVKLALSEVKTRFARVNEQNMVARVLSSPTMRNNICFECEDVMLLKEYIKGVENSVGEGNVQFIELDKLDGSELVGDLNNIFLRAINEDEVNVFLIAASEECPSEYLEAVLNFTDSFKRAHFKVKKLGVELNLSAVCVALFVDSAVRGPLQGHVTFVTFGGVTEDEKQAILDGEIKTLLSSGEFGDGLTLDEDARKRLVAMELEDSTVVLRQAARHAFIDGSSVITRENILKSFEELGPNSGHLGFGRRG